MVQCEIHTLLTYLFLGHFCADDLTDEILLLHCGRNGLSAKKIFFSFLFTGNAFGVNGWELKYGGHKILK